MNIIITFFIHPHPTERNVKMNVFWWITIGGAAIAVICLIIAVGFGIAKGSAVDNTLGALFSISVSVVVVCFIFALSTDSRRAKEQQKKHLQKIGFSYVNINSEDEAVVSMPAHAKGCRLKLEKDSKFWILSLPKDQSHAITTANEVALWPSVVEWCKQPQ